MDHPKKQSIGRPRRQPIDIVRTVYWYEFVKQASRLSESKLEIKFDELDREARGMHRGSRWNKYKFGSSSPSRELIERVELAFAGTQALYDHVLWDLVSGQRLRPAELRVAIARLPGKVARLFIDPSATQDSPFWLLLGFNYQDVIRSLVKLMKNGRLDHFFLVAALIAIAHDGSNRQFELQHFEAHVMLAKSALGYRFPVGSPLAWRLEAMVFGKWLETDYRDASLRKIVADLRGLESGPSPPWLIPQQSLPLGKLNPMKVKMEEWEAKAFWTASKLAVHELSFDIWATDDTCRSTP